MTEFEATLKEYTIGANLVLSGMGEAPASEDDMRDWFQGEVPADAAADDFAYYRREAAKLPSPRRAV